MCKTTLSTAALMRLSCLLLCVVLLGACGSDASIPRAPGPSMEDNFQGDWQSGMNGDALEAPAQPDFRIRAAPATLLFDWTPLSGQRTARLYHHDTLLSGETLVYESDDPQLGSLHLPVNTPGIAWHREQYRLELCTADNCVSSVRLPLTDLARATQQQLSPPVFLQGERYAEQLALNHDASLAVMSMPLEGALEFQIRTGSQWSLTQHLRLEDSADSATRRLYPSSSATGDTVALYLSDENPDFGQEIRILERLGETWVQTDSWSLDADIASSTDYGIARNFEDHSASGYADATHDTAQGTLQLSADGDYLLLQADNSLRAWFRNEAGWNTDGTAAHTLLDADSYIASMSPENMFEGGLESAAPARLISSAASRHFERIAALVEQDGTLYLDVWQATERTDAWQQSAHLQLSDFDADHELAMQLGAQGDELLIAGWEAGNTADRTPIMWRYSLDTTPGSQGTTDSIVLQHRDSLRASPAAHPQATLVFSADESLTLAAMGWQVSEDTEASVLTGDLVGALADAAVSTWQYHSSTRQWLSALELPEAIPTLAKQAFTNGVKLSPDGSTLMMTLSGDSAGRTRGDAVMVLR